MINRTSFVCFTRSVQKPCQIVKDLLKHVRSVVIMAVDLQQLAKALEASLDPSQNRQGTVIAKQPFFDKGFD